MAGVVRVALLGRYFDLSTFGYFIICVSLVTFVRVILKIGLGDTVLRFFPEFEQKGKTNAVSSLVVLTAYVSLAVSALIILLGFFLAGPIAESWYDKPELARPIQLIAFLSGSFLLAHSATAILRVQDEFHLAIIFPSLGACVGPLGIFLFHRFDALSVDTAVLAVGLGDFIAATGAAAVAVFKTWGKITISREVLCLRPLREFSQEIRSTLLQTSLFGILQSGTQVGGLFLLGILGTPVQVALLGMSTQLARPLNLMQSSIGSAIAPEVTRMLAGGKVKSLLKFLKRYFQISTGSMMVLFGGAWFLVPEIVPHVLTPDYLEAIPVFLVFLASSGLMIIFQPCLPVAIARGEVGRRNLAVCVRFLYLGLACLPGLTAMGVALSILMGNVTIRIVNDLPLIRRLQRSLGDQ